MKGKLLTTALGVGALMLAAGAAHAQELDNYSFTGTLSGCNSGECTFKGTGTFEGESLHDSSCLMGGTIPEPGGPSFTGYIGLLHPQLQSPTTCPDANLLYYYEGDAQELEIINTFPVLESNGTLAYGLSTYSEIQGVVDGQIAPFGAVGQTDWNPAKPTAINGFELIQTAFE